MRLCGPWQDFFGALEWADAGMYGDGDPVEDPARDPLALPMRAPAGPSPFANCKQPPSTPLSPQQLSLHILLLREAVADMQWAARGGVAADDSPDDSFAAQLAQPFPAAFAAGRLADHGPIWREYFNLTYPGGRLTPSAKDILRWLDQGVTFDFVRLEDASIPRSPNHSRNLRVVAQHLRQAGYDPAQLLHGDRPSPVRLPNHASALEHGDFVTTTLRACIEKGVASRWDYDAWGEPTVVSPLRIVEKEGKLRRCINPMYINLFIRYKPVHYESLRDLTTLLHEDSYMFTLDDKSGESQAS